MNARLSMLVYCIYFMEETKLVGMCTPQHNNILKENDKPTKSRVRDYRRGSKGHCGERILNISGNDLSHTTQRDCFIMAF